MLKMKGPGAVGSGDQAQEKNIISTDAPSTTEARAQCLVCANPVSGRQTYCSDRCRQRGRKGPRALRCRRGQNRQVSFSQPIDPIKEFKPTFDISDLVPALRRPVVDLVGTDLLQNVVATESARSKPVPAAAYKRLKLEQVNPCTWKVVDPKIKTDVPASHGQWAGYRTTKALAWIIERGPQPLA